MTTSRSLDVSALPVYSISSDAPLWWGQLLLTFIEGSMFCILIAMYFYYRLRLDMWPPPGTQLPHVLLPSIGVAVLVVSALGSYWASEAAKEDNRRKMIFGLVFNIVLAFAFLAVRILEWRSLNFNWAADIHGSIVWAILALHSLDLVADVAFTIVLLIYVAIGRYGPKQRLGVHVDSVVWYFIVLIWLPLYAVIYWGPRYVGAP